ncbi:hypothetical protein C8F01DRAFT_1110689 [Mycena amicta]|nr:hypothetical protein C8F01DRAFT_1110689 [Mycena amicta]
MKKLSSPLPQSLPKECEKSRKIVASFVDAGNNGLDGFIPRTVLEQAKGFAIFTVFKAGFLFSARAGTGVVIARLPDGTWSAPSAIGTAGLGVGSQLGAEMTDFLIVLNSRAAVQTFMASGSLSLGGNMSLAVGPLGRHGEASGSLNTSGKVAAMYSYSKTRGLFGGLSIEGSVIVERQDANVQAYGSQVTAKLLLGGAIPPPTFAQGLCKTLDACTGMPGNRQWISESGQQVGYAFATPVSETPPTQLRKKRKDQKTDFPPASWGEARDGGSYFSQQVEAASLRDKPQYDSSFDPWDAAADTSNTAQFPTQFKSDFVREKQYSRSATTSHPPTVFDLFDADPPAPSPSSPFGEEQPMLGHTRSMSASPYKPKAMVTPFKPRPELSRSPAPDGVARAVALYDFQAVQPGDLSFSKGDIIVITKRSQSTDDWWTGTLDGRKGIFPANFVDVL